jgi:transcriptional regulator with XRE-family HTH domain
MAEIQSDKFFANIERNIRQLTKANGMTLAELAKAIEMTEAGFYKMLSTESMKVKTLIKLAEVLKQPVTDFFEPHAAELRQDSSFTNEVAEPEGVYVIEKDSLKKQIALLESQIEDKNKIIQLLSNK